MSVPPFLQTLNHLIFQPCDSPLPSAVLIFSVSGAFLLKCFSENELLIPHFRGERCFVEIYVYLFGLTKRLCSEPTVSVFDSASDLSSIG